jgi:hypothetical protein
MTFLSYCLFSLIFEKKEKDFENKQKGEVR